MDNLNILKRNMLAITSCQGPICASRIQNAQEDTRIGIITANDGSIVPYMDIGGRRAYMHSQFEPKKEARRLADTYKTTGFYVFFGLGAAYELLEIANDNKITRAIIIEYGAGILKGILQRIDLSNVFSDSRFTLLVDPSKDELEKAIYNTYKAVISGDFTTVTLRGRSSSHHNKYLEAADTIRALISNMADDYTVQTFFGKKWFTNIIHNIALTDLPTKPIGPIQSAIIAAAGPSLETAIKTMSLKQKSVFLISTDTALRALLSHNIIPDAVISIDCQHISYYHFSLGLPEGVPLFLDLASPTSISRLTQTPYFFSSGHPLAGYIASNMRAFPALDTSGGNVTHAALSLAMYLGAKDITIYGADFSYPKGKTYARGSYIYPYFDIRQSRLKPFESLFTDFVYRNPSLQRISYSDDEFAYTTKTLIGYKDKLDKFCSNSECNIRRISYMGETVYNSNNINQGKLFTAGRSWQKPLEFLKTYKNSIHDLPPPYKHASAYIDGLSAVEKDIWMTMLPTAATLKKLQNYSAEPHELLEITRAWCEKVIDYEILKLSNATKATYPNTKIF